MQQGVARVNIMHIGVQDGEYSRIIPRLDSNKNLILAIFNFRYMFTILEVSVSTTAHPCPAEPSCEYLLITTLFSTIGETPSATGFNAPNFGHIIAPSNSCVGRGLP